MTPDSITTLVKVRKALNKAPSQHTPLFISLIDSGANSPFSCKPAVRLAFGQNESDFPNLGKKISPFHASKVPPLEELQSLLIKDLQAARQSERHIDTNIQHFTKDAKTDEYDQRLDLLTSLTNGDQTIGGSILGFHSPSLDDTCSDSKIEYDNVLRESMMMATILPAGTLVALQHSNEGNTFTSLLSGSVAWIVWPPTPHNLDMLKNYYYSFPEGTDGTKVDAYSQLQGGVCLVQSTGEALRIPPFCPILCLSLTTSVLGTYSVVTASQLANMLEKLPLLLAWFKTEADGENKKRAFATAILSHLSAILQGRYEETDLRKCRYPYATEGPLHSLLRIWDGIKHAVASILKPAEAEQMIATWDTFLRHTRGRYCWLCGKDVRNKPKEMRRHFEVKHWMPDESAQYAEPLPQPQDGTDRVANPSGISEEPRKTFSTMHRKQSSNKTK